MSDEVREGDVLAGKFRIERVLGQGAMGVVVAATHIQLDERVALKFLLPEALANADAVARFAREARAAVKIKSEHVVRVSDVGTLESGSPYMVMEYLQGQDLSEWMTNHGTLNVSDAVEFLLQACEALAEAHALGIVHRDLKPANLFVTARRDGTPCIKVLDFGISKFTAPGSNLNMTKTSTIMGSPLYMSPEQLSSTRTVDARTDIWALGVILFELISGRVPFEAETMPELCGKVLMAPPPSLRDVGKGLLPDALDAIVFRCLAKDRTQRYANVAELATALAPLGPPNATRSAEKIERILRASGSLVSSDPALSPAVMATTGNVVTLKAAQAITQRRQRSWAVWLSLPLLLAAAIAFWALRRPAPPLEHAAEPPQAPALAAAPPVSAVTAAPLVPQAPATQAPVAPAPVATPPSEPAVPVTSLHAKPSRPEPAARSMPAPTPKPDKPAAASSPPAPVEPKPSAPAPARADPLEDRR
jgi:serine/threonine-protein kinase